LAGRGRGRADEEREEEPAMEGVKLP